MLNETVLIFASLPQLDNAALGDFLRDFLRDVLGGFEWIDSINRRLAKGFSHMEAMPSVKFVQVVVVYGLLRLLLARSKESRQTK